jgi:uncharacterized protein YjiS (DUF1127 family)
MTAMIATTFNRLGFETIANWFRNLNTRMERRAKIKMTINELSRLTDHELNDIGISRGDIWWVAHEAEFDDYSNDKNYTGWM